jgi:predicted DNA binding CopG/RHH family protein
MSASAKLKPFPKFASDEEAVAFVETADLTKYDFSGFQPMQFELERKATQVNLRMPASLLKAVKVRAQSRGIPYQRFIREALEKALRTR